MQTQEPKAPGAPTQNTPGAPVSTNQMPAPGAGPDSATKNTAPNPDDTTTQKFSDEAARWRTQFREAEKTMATLQAEVDKFKNAGKSDVERLTAELAAAKAGQAATISMVVESQIMVAAVDSGLEPKAAAKLIMADADLRSLVKTEGDTITGIKDALAAAQKAYPILVKPTAATAATAAAAPGVPPTNPGGNAGRPLHTDAQLRGMTQEAINADWEHVKKSIQANATGPNGAKK